MKNDKNTVGFTGCMANPPNGEDILDSSNEEPADQEAHSDEEANKAEVEEILYSSDD
jgi:hypothetical protein